MIESGSRGPLSRQAQALLEARSSGRLASWQEILPAGRTEAYRVQDETVARLGAVGGWKVGAKGRSLEPACAPLPARGLLASGVKLPSAAWPLRGMEVELALRLGKDLTPSAVGPDVWAAFDAMLPVIEVVETRLADWRHADPLAQLADLQSHGALIIGDPHPMPREGLDLGKLEARLAFGGETVAATAGGNPAGDVKRLLIWLAAHCFARGMPLKAGQIITTGSCTGMLFAPAGCQVTATLSGLGKVCVEWRQGAEAEPAM